jgi:hypothetical protein
MSPLLFPFVHYYLVLLNDSFGLQEKNSESYFFMKLKLFPMNSFDILVKYLHFRGGRRPKGKETSIPVGLLSGPELSPSESLS